MQSRLLVPLKLHLNAPTSSWYTSVYLPACHQLLQMPSSLMNAHLTLQGLQPLSITLRSVRLIQKKVSVIMTRSSRCFRVIHNH